jgi:hypothetical protein
MYLENIQDKFLARLQQLTGESWNAPSIAYNMNEVLQEEIKKENEREINRIENGWRIDELLEYLSEELKMKIDIQVGPHIRLWRLGDAKNRIIPSQQQVENFVNAVREFKDNETYQCDDIVWHPGVSLEILKFDQQ